MDRKTNAGWSQVRKETVTAVPLPAPAPLPYPPGACGADEDDGMVLAMSYVKMQKWGELYEPDVGFGRGTIFPDLDLPFVGEGACPK